MAGESLEGWTLNAIESGEIVLTNGDQRETLILHRGKVTVASPAVKAAEAGVGRPVRQYEPGAPATPAGKTSGASTVEAAKKGTKKPGKPAPERRLGLGPA